MKLWCAFFLLFSTLFAISVEEIKSVCKTAYVLQGTTPDEQVMLCCHGYTQDCTIIEQLKAKGFCDHHLVGFNFPDFGVGTAHKEPTEVRFGTFEELVPLFVHLRRLVCDAKLPKIHLYGFSAGGGAVINALAILNQGRYTEKLQSLGLGLDQRAQIVAALRQGSVTLDCPLKSMEEIIAARGKLHGFEYLQKQYAKNQMRPIDAITQIEGMHLEITLHFQNPDLTISNRDDSLFIERLRHANRSGKNHVVVGHEGRHVAAMHSLIEKKASMG